MLIYIITIIISMAAAYIFYYKTKPELPFKQWITLLVLRTIVLILLFLFLLTPIVYYIRHYTQQSVVVLLKDISASMQLKHQDKTKAEELNSAYENIKKAFKKTGYSIEEYEFADGLSKNKTNTLIIPILESIRKQNKTGQLSNVVIFSDGWFRDPDMRSLRNIDIPLHTVADTSRYVVSDLQLVDLRHNRQGYRNEISLFEANVKSIEYKGSALVRFLVNGKTVKEKSVSFQKEQNQLLTFDYRFTQTGLQKVEMQIFAKGIDERIPSNNNYLSAIDILNDKERMLLLTDAPNWDTKFILDVIRENNRIEPISLTLKGNELYLGEQKTRFDNWDNVTAIIIVNQGSMQLSNTLTSQIINQVNNGCGLLYMGLPMSQLSAILPLQQSNIRSSYKGLFRLLPAAGAFSAMQIPSDELSQIPPLDYYYLIKSNQSEVIASMDNVQKSPAIAVSTMPGGKVVSFSFLNIWRWQMQSKSQAYKTFIHDITAWLSNKSSGQLSAIYEPSYNLNESIEIKFTAIDEVRKLRKNLMPRIIVYNAKNDSIFSDFMIVDQDEYNINFKVKNTGEYRFRISEQVSGQSVTGRFFVQSQDIESRDLSYNIPLLNWISVQTGGKFIDVNETPKFNPIKAVDTHRIERKEFPLYRKWYLITLFIVVFCTELFYRRRWGLL